MKSHSIHEGSAIWIHHWRLGRFQLELKRYKHTGILPDRNVYQTSLIWDRKRKHTVLGADHPWELVVDREVHDEWPPDSEPTYSDDLEISQ